MKTKPYPNIKYMIYEIIKNKIIDLQLKPGDFLSDRNLARQLNVSRTPVREALTLLQKENFVIQHPKRGFRVNEISLKNISDMYEAREAIESTALKISAKKHVISDLEKLSQLLKHHEKLIETFEPQGKFLEDAQFHKSLMEISGNQYMLEILESIFQRIQMLRNIDPLSKRRVKTAFYEHVHIFECFKKGLYSEAEQMLCKHIMESKNDLINRIKNRFELLHFNNR
jgi:DNA-binding GntR family transcriptional regulator